MGDQYFDSAMDAAADLGLPLLLATSSAPAVPRHAERLSDFSPEIMHGSRLFRRFPFPRGVAAPTIWITGPRGTTEHLAWAVGLAEQAARSGLTAYVADLEPSAPLRVLAPGAGRPLPGPVRARLASLSSEPCSSWASDLQGVRIVLPVTATHGDAGSAPDRWILVVSRSIPEADEFPIHECDVIDGVCFTAAIRDHSKEELGAAVHLLRGSGRELLGLVAMGPLPAAQVSPLERWERRPEVPAPGVQQGPTLPEPQPIGFDGGSQQTVSPLPRQEGVKTVERPVRLVSDWHRPRKSSPTPWVVIGFCALFGLLVIWLRSSGGSFGDLIPKGILRGARDLVVSVGESLRREDRMGQGGVKEETPRGLPSSGEREESSPSVARSDSSSYPRPGWDKPSEGEVAGFTQGAFLDSAQTLVISETGEARFGSARSAPVPFEPPGSLAPSESAMTSTAGYAAGDSVGSRAQTSVARQSAAPDTGDTALRDSTVTQPVTESSIGGWPDTFVVHVSSFRRRGEADQEASRMRASGLDARVVSVVLPERGRWHRVVVGAFPDSVSAALEADRLRTNGLVSFAQMIGHGGRGAPRDDGAR